MMDARQTIAVWFSCGAASAVAAKLTIEKYGSSYNVRVLNNPVAEEDSDNRRFLDDVEAWLGVQIESVVNPHYPNCSAVEVWESRQFMSGPHGAPCTIELKKRARQHWEKQNAAEWIVMGFTAEEKNRHDLFALTERSNILPVLIEAGMTKQICMDYLAAEGIKLPHTYAQGYPNANCIGCVKATAPDYWNLVRSQHPDVFAQRAAQSRRIGARLVRVKGARIFLDELKITDRGRPLKKFNFDCGIFCEERPDDRR
jgi:3'-phosphoadenosine 5'-phosphosulfate sulfotransferase (PAPS reductase)/FAD synthetase